MCNMIIKNNNFSHIPSEKQWFLLYAQRSINRIGKCRFPLLESRPQTSANCRFAVSEKVVDVWFYHAQRNNFARRWRKLDTGKERTAAQKSGCLCHFNSSLLASPDKLPFAVVSFGFRMSVCFALLPPPEVAILCNSKSQITYGALKWTWSGKTVFPKHMHQ